MFPLEDELTFVYCVPGVEPYQGDAAYCQSMESTSTGSETPFSLTVRGFD
jgi:hypothetical protein